MGSGGRVKRITRLAHNQETAGSTPATATKIGGFGEFP